MVRKTKQQVLKNVALATLLAGSASPLTAQAAGFVESTDFSNNLASPTLLPSEVSDVSGTMIPSDTFDVFLVSGFQGGAAYTLSFSTPILSGGTMGLDNYFYYINGALVGSGNYGEAPHIFSGTMPLNGQLNIGIQTNLEAGGTEIYNVNLTAPLAAVVPEPATLSLLALGLAGLAGARKRLSRNQD